jgi:hypothetical protein
VNKLTNHTMKTATEGDRNISSEFRDEQTTPTQTRRHTMNTAT